MKKILLVSFIYLLIACIFAGYAHAISVGNMSFIKSIQTVTVTFGGGDFTATKTISSVNTDNTIVNNLGSKTSINGFNLAGITLTNATTLSAIRLGSGDTSATTVQVIEFMGAVIKSIQHGTIIMPLGKITTYKQLATPVNENKSLLFCRGKNLVDDIRDTDVQAFIVDDRIVMNQFIQSGSVPNVYFYTVVEFAEWAAQ